MYRHPKRTNRDRLEVCLGDSDLAYDVVRIIPTDICRQELSRVVLAQGAYGTHRNVMDSRTRQPDMFLACPAQNVDLGPLGARWGTGVSPHMARSIHSTSVSLLGQTTILHQIWYKLSRRLRRPCLREILGFWLPSYHSE